MNEKTIDKGLKENRDLINKLPTMLQIGNLTLSDKGLPFKITVKNEPGNVYFLKMLFYVSLRMGY